MKTTFRELYVAVRACLTPIQTSPHVFNPQRLPPSPITSHLGLLGLVQRSSRLVVSLHRKESTPRALSRVIMASNSSEVGHPMVVCTA